MICCFLSRYRIRLTDDQLLSIELDIKIAQQRRCWILIQGKCLWRVSVFDIKSCQRSLGGDCLTEALNRLRVIEIDH